MMQASLRRRSSRTGAGAAGAGVAGAGATAALIEGLEPRTLFSAAPAATPAQLVAQANNAFAFDLWRQLAPDSSGNTFFSPYSAATALEMALQGAQGVTASEMIQALHLPSSDIAQAGIQALEQLFQATPATAGYTLSSANRLWVNDNFTLLQSFLNSSQSVFGASPQSVDFSDPAAAANTINTWVSDQTDGKITDLIPASDLSALTGLVLTNAVYFQGNWADAFDPTLTAPAPFQIASTEAATVQMMQQTTSFGYYAQTGASGFQAVDLHYQGNNLDMLVILPTSGDLDSFESTFTPALFGQITTNLMPANVDLDLPKFQLNEAYDMIPPLENLGITTAFGSGADFSGISDQPIYISAVAQKSFVNVDEAGTTAAAATGVVGTIDAVAFDPNPPIAFDANHPFLFAIRDNATNTILFLGGVSDPSNGAADYVTPATAPTPAPGSGAGSNPVSIISVNNDPLPEAIVPNVKTSDLSLRGVAGRNFQGPVGVLRGVTSEAPKLAALSGTIDWGDGSSSAASFVRVGEKAIAVRGTHSYASAGSYTIGINVTQTPYANGKPTGAAPSMMPTMDATATIESPAASSQAPISVVAGQAFTATLGSASLPPIPAGATRGVIIRWGDGSHSAGTLTPNGAAFAITASHLYRSHGKFPVLIDIWQKNNGKQTILTHLAVTAIVSPAAD